MKTDNTEYQNTQQTQIKYNKNEIKQHCRKIFKEVKFFWELESIVNDPS